VLTVIGASLLWVGWFGFNAGSAVAANGLAGVAMTTTQVATAMAALAWMFSEWLVHGKPSVLGIASGAVAGLVAITPAAGFVDPKGALVIGAAAGVGCYIMSTGVKKLLGYDDSLDVFGVHGVGGFVGTILAGLFGASAFGGNQEGLAVGAQLGKQIYAAFVTAAWSAVASWALLKGVDAAVGLRVGEEAESQGLDLALHDERGYNL
jgi:Amt family ammonium transporter